MEKPVPAATRSGCPAHTDALLGATDPVGWLYWPPPPSDLPQGSPASSSCDLCGKDKGRTVLQPVCPSRPARPWVVGFLVEGRWAGTQGTTGRAAGLGGFFQSSVTPSSRAHRLTQCPPYPLSPSGIPWASPPAGPSSPSCPRPRAERGWICPRAGGVWEGVGPVCHIQPGGYCPFVGVARGWRLVSLGKHHRRGSLDTRSLSSDGSGGWKSKINVPTGLFPLRPFSLQVDGRYPLFS